MRKILALPFLCLVFIFVIIASVFMLLHILVAHGWEDCVEASSDLFDSYKNKLWKDF